jgi:hypothetical protein
MRISRRFQAVVRSASIIRVRLSWSRFDGVQGRKNVSSLTLKTLGIGRVSWAAEPSALMMVTVGRDIVTPGVSD